MAADPAPAERPDPHASMPLTGSSAHTADGHRVLRLPGGEPGPRIGAVPAVSVRRTVGLPDRSGPSAMVGRLVRATAWGVATSVIAVGSILLHQMLFTGDSQLEEFLSTSRSGGVVSAAGLRPLTNDDPDLPGKADLVVPPLGPEAIAVPPQPAAQTPVSSGPSSPGSGPAASEDTVGSGSSAADHDDESSGHGSDDGDSSGHGSDHDGDSSGHGADHDGDSSGDGSGRD